MPRSALAISLVLLIAPSCLTYSQKAGSEFDPAPYASTPSHVYYPTLDPLGPGIGCGGDGHDLKGCHRH